MSKEIWLSVDEVSQLSEETKETVRRKCKRGEYVAGANFPSEKTFGRYLKKDVSPALIEHLRNPCDKVLAKDLSNHKTNECWCIESYQLDFLSNIYYIYCIKRKFFYKNLF